MSFDPRLVISYKDLIKHKEKLEATWDWEEEDKEVLEYLASILIKDPNPFTICGVELISCQPEFTKFNQSVRDMLNEWEVEYTLDH